MVADRVSERLLVVGAGAIGIEFAGFFHTMGQMWWLWRHTGVSCQRRMKRYLRWRGISLKSRG